MFAFGLLMVAFVSSSDPVLQEVADEVCPCNIPKEETQQIVKEMVEMAYSNPKNPSQPICVGLAAPQFGIPDRIILVNIAATGIVGQNNPADLRAYINPQILWRSEETSRWREGCFSTPCICGIVPRAQRILLRAYDVEGRLLTQEFEGYVARVFQHEIDHLDGIRFPDRIDNDDDLHWVDEEELPEYRIHWASWQKKCPREKWLEMKRG
jgi:peptide deformylase